MVITNQVKNQHLLWRAGFGPIPEEFSQLQTAAPSAYFDALVKASSSTPQYLDVADDYLKGLAMGVDDVVKQSRRELTAEEKKKARKQSREDLRNLNLKWLDEMVNSESQLREKMALFWHGHFACRVVNIFYQQLLLDEIRRNALGNFGDMLKAVSRSGAMINFLNNNQNRKQHPNENFAREVMELFTLGRGNYTENDVKEAARAFTGWGANLRGEFQFRPGQHDNGSKTVFGKTGNFDGDDILSMLLEQKQTARFIARKAYRYFVNEQVEEDKLTWLSDRFYQSNYDIKGLMKDIFTSAWFFEAKHIGTRIKSPVELIVGVRRILPMKLENEEVMLLLQKVLGQILFYPPNVAGWAGGKTWIDSSTLMMRLRIPQLIYDAGEFNINPKSDDDQAMGMMEGQKVKGMGKIPARQQIKADVDWKLYIAKFEKVSRENLVKAISETILQTPAGTISESLLKGYADAGSRESFIKTITIALMSTPEFQLC
jgi:uncharacterized protein (DUF1800 family)